MKGKRIYEEIDDKRYISECCKEDVIMEGETTKYYVCGKCRKPCNVKKTLFISMEEEKIREEYYRNHPLNKF